MNTNWQDVARATLEGSESGAMTFAETLRMLAEAGVEGYAVDFRRSTRTYYTPEGEAVELGTERTPARVAEPFDAAVIKAALREAQAQSPGYTYRGFCAKVAGAGCAGYLVSLIGRRVLYYGRTGETHTEYFPGSRPASSTATVRSVTKTVRLDCDPQAAFEFLADLGNWPRWAVVNVKATSRSADPDWWDMVTPRGAARLRMRSDARYGILDHDFVDAQASWTVPARVIANGSGAEFMITFFQPPAFTDAFFDQQIELVDVELAKLKELLKVA
ncbi:DUF1398 domain-containing protein [Pseudorhodoplanes sp.]|uniref:DUF1398 domain-containing protein n=1 Tax=Pseudorhodoplanes sp. TaxID=1934341 RepID=UPI003D12C780